MNRPLTIRQGDARHDALLRRMYGSARHRYRLRTGVALTSDEPAMPPMTRAMRKIREQRRTERTTR